MEHHFESAYNNYWHFTVESILPIIHNLDKIAKGDVVYVPNYPIYPISFIRKILPECEVMQVEATPPKVYVEGYLRTYNNYELIRSLCDTLTTFVPKHKNSKPSLFFNFRLHNRCWFPNSNLQQLIDSLNTEYNVYLSLNPASEGVVEIPEFTGVTKIYDLSYEDQLAYANSCVGAIYMNGAGMVFPQLANLPAVMLTPCKYTSRAEYIDINYNQFNKIKILSDNKELFGNWNADVVNVSVNGVLEQFNIVMGEK